VIAPRGSAGHRLPRDLSAARGWRSLQAVSCPSNHWRRFTFRRALFGAALALHLLWTSLLMNPVAAASTTAAASITATADCHESGPAQAPAGGSSNECHCAGNLSVAAPAPPAARPLPVALGTVPPTLVVTLIDTEPERELRPPILS